LANGIFSNFWHRHREMLHSPKQEDKDSKNEFISVTKLPYWPIEVRGDEFGMRVCWVFNIPIHRKVVNKKTDSRYFNGGNFVNARATSLPRYFIECSCPVSDELMGKSFETRYNAQVFCLSLSHITAKVIPIFGISQFSDLMLEISV